MKRLSLGVAAAHAQLLVKNEVAEIAAKKERYLDGVPFNLNPVWWRTKEPEQWQGKGKRRKPKQR